MERKEKERKREREREKREKWEKGESAVGKEKVCMVCLGWVGVKKETLPWRKQ